MVGEKGENMKVSEILKVVKDCKQLHDILMRDEELTAEDKMHICNLLWDYRCELLKKEVE